MKHLYLPAFLAIFLLTACTPLRVVRMEPANEAEVDRYLYGNPILS